MFYRGLIRVTYLNTPAVVAVDVRNIVNQCMSSVMVNTDQVPSKRSLIGPYRRLSVPVTSMINLPAPGKITGSLAAALDCRQSASQFELIDHQRLSTWLYYSAARKELHFDDANLEKRYVGSFGALHPAHILLKMPGQSWCVYLPYGNQLGVLPVDAAVANELCNLVTSIFNSTDATVVALLSDVDLAENYYSAPTELLLRDGGVLLGHGAIVASGLGLNYRILGGTGAPWLEKLIIDLPFKPMATGLALLG